MSEQLRLARESAALWAALAALFAIQNVWQGYTWLYAVTAACGVLACAINVVLIVGDR